MLEYKYALDILLFVCVNIKIIIPPFSKEQIILFSSNCILSGYYDF